MISRTHSKRRTKSPRETVMEFLIGVVVGAVGFWAWGKWGHMIPVIGKKNGG